VHDQPVFNDQPLSRWLLSMAYSPAMQPAGDAAGESQWLDLDPETRDDALDVLYDLLSWRATAQRWATIAMLVESMAAAFANRDWDALRSATIELELVSPVRVGTPGDKPQQPPPKPVRDQTNHLVHSLEKTKPGR